MGSTTILGLDPSTRATGWCALAVEGQEEGVVASGVWRPERREPFEALLVEAYRWLLGAAEVHGPAVLAIETPFFALNARTLATLAALGGVFRLAGRLAGMEVHLVPPAKRCTAVGLRGNASKAEVLYVVNAVYNLNLSDHNEADAVAIAAAGARWVREENLERRT